MAIDAFKDIKLIIFDLDGTLLQSVEFNCHSINKALEMLGYRERVNSETIEEHLGEASEEFYKHILPETCLLHWKEIRNQHKSHIHLYMSQFGKEFPDVTDTLKVLKEREYKLALYSNCSPDYMEKAMDKLGINEYLDYRECTKQNELTKTELIRKILHHFDKLPAAIVGDRIHDIESARENGILSIGATYGYGKDDLDQADATIRTFTQLQHIFERSSRPIRNSAKAIIIKDKKIVGIQCKDEEGFFYILPGGGVEKGETVLQALHRECKEEISVDIIAGDLRYIREYIGAHHEFSEFDYDIHQIEYMFPCEIVEGQTIQNGAIPDMSQVGIEWLDLDRLEEYRLYPQSLKKYITKEGRLEGPVYLGDTN